MFVEFDEMAESSRVWIYQSDTKLDAQLREVVESQGRDFCNHWEAHGNPLKSSVKVLYDQFIIITVDEAYNMATGCSIDKSVDLVRKLEQSLGISLFDRTKVAFLKNDEVFTKPMNSIKNEISAGVIDQNTVTFNNLVQNLGELKQKWQVPVGDSWLKRYFA